MTDRSHATADREPEPADPCTPTEETALRPHRWFEVSLLALLVVSVLVRFGGLATDPPYSIVSTSGTFLTDEGWYSKSAQLHARFGD